MRLDKAEETAGAGNTDDATGITPHSRCVEQPTVSEQLEKMLGHPWPFQGRPPRHDLSTWTVIDDWPDPVPVTEAEIEVFERWFGDLFDDLFGPETLAQRIVF